MMDAATLVELTMRIKPETPTHWSWSTRKMAAAQGVSPNTVMPHWQARGPKPLLVRGFESSRDPRFIEKPDDVVSLYMSPPDHAIVLCWDKKNQVQALDRAQPMMHDCKRPGTTTLFAALNVLDGKAIGQSQQHHTHSEWLRFLRKIDRQVPKGETSHLIADSYAAHKHPAVQRSRDKQPRFHMRSAPASSASLLNMVECFFHGSTAERLRRGVVRSVSELEAAIDEYVAHQDYNP